MHPMKKLIIAGAIALASIAAQAKDIVDTAVAAGSFKMLAAALKAAGLVDTLNGKGPFHCLRADRRSVR